MKRKILKWGLIVFAVGLVTAVSIFLYMWYMPHRDVQAAPVDIEITAVDLVNEYLNDPETANEKYLQEEGESKILAVSGKVSAIDEDLNHQKTVLLKNENDQAGVLCFFMAETNANAEELKIGDQITIKGVIRSGAEYDEDLDLYEDAILEKCDVLKQ